MGKKKRESSIECVKNNPFIPKVKISMQLDVSIPAIIKVLKEDEWKIFGISFVLPFYIGTFLLKVGLLESLFSGPVEELTISILLLFSLSYQSFSNIELKYSRGCRHNKSLLVQVLDLY